MQYFNNLQERIIQNELISIINSSEHSLKVAVTWFTNHDLFNAVLRKLEIPDFQVDLIVLNDRINNKAEGLDFQKLIDCGGNFFYSNVDSMVHHKFCIIDDKVVITGSYNWTYYAEQRNWENVLVIDEAEIVNAYVKEFDIVRQHHQRIKNISSQKRLDVSMNTNEYLTTDYSIQVEKESKRGNDLAVAKIYTEILRIDHKQPEIQKARNAIVQKINSQNFETCPFEIGIHFLSGYKKIIPAFAPLPITKQTTGLDPSGNSRSLQITIEKYDYSYTTLLQFSMDLLKPCPVNTPKIGHALTVDKYGILTVDCVELNGYGRRQTHRVDLKKYL